MAHKPIAAATVQLAQRSVPVLSLHTLTSTLVDRMSAAPFLHAVLPPLMARMAVSLDAAPSSLSSMPALTLLRDWYAESAGAIETLEAPPSDTWRTKPSKTFLEREERLRTKLEALRVKGREVRESLVEATYANGGLFRNKHASAEIDEFLTSFYERRLTLRLLLGQYAACRMVDRDDEIPNPNTQARGFEEFIDANDAARDSNEKLNYIRSTFESLDLNNDGQLDPDELALARSLYAREEPSRGRADLTKPSVVGLVDFEMSSFDVACQAVADVQAECKMSEFRIAPPFTMHGIGQGTTMAYLPRHLYKILRDLLRNAATATLRKHVDSRRLEPMHPIQVVISDSATNDDIAIKVSDEAGGIPRSKVRTIFSFAKTADNEQSLTSVLADQDLCRALAPLEPNKTNPVSEGKVGGHGLPISRVYARYFDGDLRIRSTPPVGTDAYLYISRINENLLPT